MIGLNEIEINGTVCTFSTGNTNDVANAVKATKSFTNIVDRIDDISPLEHDIDIKLRSKNLLVYPYVNMNAEESGIAFTYNPDGSFHIKGTAAETIYKKLCHIDLGATNFSTNIYSTNGKYVLSGLTEADIGLYLSYSASNKHIHLVIVSGTTVDKTIYPQLEEGISPTAWQSYVIDENIGMQYTKKNLIPYPYTSGNSFGTIDGITFTDMGDGSVGVKGTATSNVYFNIVRGGIDFGSSNLDTRYASTQTYDAYVISGGPMDEDLSEYSVIYQAANKNIVIFVRSGVSVDTVVYPQIELGTVATGWVSPVKQTKTITQFANIVRGFTSTELPLTLVNATTNTDKFIIDVSYNADTTKKLVNLDNKLDNIIKTTGDIEDAVMLQKADIGELNTRINDTTKEVANAVKATKSFKNRIDNIDDISPLEHDIDIKLKSKNLLVYPYINMQTELFGITFTHNSDGSFHIKGTAAETIYKKLCSIDLGLQNFSTPYYETVDGVDVLIDYRSEKYTLSGVTEEDRGLNIAYNGTEQYVYLGIKAGTTVDKTIYPQLEEGTEATEWQSYIVDNNIGVIYKKRNLLSYPYTSSTEFRTINGVTFTDNGDGSITINGTNTDSNSIYFNIYRAGTAGDYGSSNLDTRWTATLRNEEGYVISGAPTDEGLCGYWLNYNCGNRQISLVIKGNATVNATVYPQVERGEVATSWQTPSIQEDKIIYPNASGDIIGFTSTELPLETTDNSVELFCEVTYNKDTNKALEDATNLPYKEYGLSVLYFNGDIKGMSKDDAVTLDYEYEGRTGSCTLKWQGSSSLAYPKKNYTVKFDSAFEVKEGWGAEKKYCLKANYIDFSHARNIVSAKLWGEVVRSRSTPNEKLETLVNCGAIDGFPICVVINGEYKGLYTFNIPKDGWLFGMGNGEQEAIVCAEGWSDATRFKGEATIGNEFELEYTTNEDDADWVRTSLNRLIRFCMNSNETTLAPTIDDCLDWDSAIDYFIFALLLNHYDGIVKNYLLATYSDYKWFFSAYDMDSTYGIHYNGKSFLKVNEATTVNIVKGQHKLFELICYHKKDELKARYAELRAGVLSEDNVITHFANFIGSIPKAIFDEEVRIWKEIPSTSTNNIAQIIDFYKRKCSAIDKEIAEL